MDGITYQRILELCKENDISVAELERRLKFGSSSIRKWITMNPSADKLKAVADFFGVSTDYLYGRTDIRKGADDVLDPDFLSLQRARQNMSAKEWDRAMSIIKAGFASAFRDNET